MNHIESIKPVLNLIKGLPKTLYNIGVGQHPHNEAEQFKERFPDIEIFGLEPQAKSFAQRYEKYCGEIYPWGLWSSEGFQKMFITTDQGNSSILKPTHASKMRWQKVYGVEIEREWIYCTTLDKFDELCEKKEDIFLWMDIEGTELEALRGGINLLQSGRVKWIELEVGLMTRREGEAKASATLEFLSKYGFSKRHTHSKCQKWANCLFTKE